jgi:hypothetical protein
MRILSGSTLSLHASPPDTANVYVDLTAEGRISSATLTNARSRNYTIDMVARGPLDKIRPEFSSTPGDLSDQDIVGLLTGKQQVEMALSKSGSSDIEGLLQSALFPTLFQTVGSASQDALGLDEFGLETGYNEPMRFTIGNRLWSGFYLDYSRVMNARPTYSDSLQELKLSYRFRQGLEVGLATNENSMVTVGVQGRVRF